MTDSPIKKGDWVADGTGQIAKVRDAYQLCGEPLIDLWLYSNKGERIGRASPALGGPRTFEPACDAANWSRIKKPEFPLRMQWIDVGNGTRRLGYPVEQLASEKSA